MDEPLRKAGQWPNVAIEAGSDPAKVMERYGVSPSVSDTDELGPAPVAKEVNDGRDR